MKNIKLKKLTLNNYRNIEFAEFEFDGNSQIIGENRIGKTNTLEAIYWLLTDKLLDGSSDVGAIKPLKDTKLEVRVKGTFDIDDKEITLEKDYCENWVSKRGTSDLIMSGHKTTWIYNGVKQPTLNAYNQLINDDFGFKQDQSVKIDFMQMLINPYFLGNMGEGKEWTDLRSFIIKLVGDVSDDDVINKNQCFEIIRNDLSLVNGRVDQLKKRYKDTIDSIKELIISKEGQIKLLESTHNPTDEEIEIAKRAISEHKDKIDMLKSNIGIDVASLDLSGKINERKVMLANLEREDLLKAQSNEKKVEIENKISEKRAFKNKLLEQKTLATTNLSITQRKLDESVENVDLLKQKRLDLISQLKEIDTSIKNPTFESECPYCHHQYEEDKVQKLRNEYISRLEENKKEKVSNGIKVKEQINAEEEKINSYKAAIDELELEINKVQNALTITESEIMEYVLSLDKIVIEPNPEIQVIKNEIEELKIKFNESKIAFQNGLSNTNQLIYDEEMAMKPFEKVIADRDYYNRQMELLEQVKFDTSDLKRKLVDAEQKKELVNQFMLIKLRMLDANVSRVFGNIKFQLVKENINGGYEAICKPYIYDTLSETSTNTTWKSGSKSERVATGIAIIESIKKELNLPNLPILFDEGGEISSNTLTNRLKTESQLICVRIADDIQVPLVRKL